MIEKNLYEVLGVSPGSGQEEIVRVYEEQQDKLLRGVEEAEDELNKPDLSSSAREKLTELLEHRVSRFDKIKEAFKTLRDQGYKYSYVTIDYDQTVKRMVKAGKFNWVDGDITDVNFPSNEEGKAQLEIFLLNFDSRISSIDVIKRMDKQGLHPATLRELLALGSAYPDLQREGRIVALGSTWHYPRDDLLVPCLDGDGSDRHLSLAWFEGGWRPSWRFAAVRK